MWYTMMHREVIGLWCKDCRWCCHNITIGHLDKATCHIIFLHNIHKLVAHWISFKDKEQEEGHKNVPGVFFDGFMLDLCQIIYV